MANYNETFYQLLVDENGDNRPLTLTAENLAQLNENVVTKSKSKTVSEDVNATIVKLKTILDGFLQQHNVLNPKDRNTIECKLSATNFSRKAFLVDGIDGTNYPGIYSFAFYDKMRKVTTISKLEKKGTGYQSQCFCQKSYLCDGEERTGDFKILLAFTNYSDTKVDLYMSMKGFPVLSNVKGGGSSKETSSSSSTSKESDGKKKRKRKEDDIQEPTKKTQASSSGLSSSSFEETPSYQSLAKDLQSVNILTSEDVSNEISDPILPFAMGDMNNTSEEPQIPQDSMMGLLDPTQATSSSAEFASLISGDVMISEPAQNFQHQLWSTYFYVTNPVFQKVYKEVEDQAKQINKLKLAGKKLLEKNKEITLENEKLKQELEEMREKSKYSKIPEHEEELVIDDDYQSNEKKPMVDIIFGEDDDSIFQNENKPEQQDAFDFLWVDNEDYDPWIDSLKQ